MTYTIWVVAGKDEQQKTCKADGCACDHFSSVVDKDLPLRVQAVCESGHSNNFRVTPPNQLQVRPG